MASLRAFSRIAFYQPRKPLYELFKGFHLDLDHQIIKTKQNLMYYSDLVGGSFFPMVFCIVLYRCDDDTYEVPKDYSLLEEDIYKLGRVIIYQ